MKTTKPALFIALLLVVSGCVGVQPYPYASDASSYQASAPMQYAPQQQVAPVGCIPPYIPVWNGCAIPMYRSQYIAPMYTGGLLYPVFEPGLWFQFNFGHRGGRHHRGR